MSLTREQERARLAFRQVSQVAEGSEKGQQKYRDITRKAQGLIRNAGLCQALHFIAGKDEYKVLVTHLQEHVAKHLGMKGDLLTLVRGDEGGLAGYLATTREVLQCLTWQSRMVDAVLGEGEED